jgi:uncharacterized protein YndB with AHSA1/START domain
MNRDRGNMVFNLLRERISQARETAHRHPHCEVLPLDIAGADVLGIPIRLIHGRWVSKYTEPWVAALSDLKHRLENKTMEKVFEIYIKTTPERLWKAITDTEMRRKYTFGAVVTSDWTPGSRYEGTGWGTPIFEGENLEIDPPRRLVQSFRALWGEDVRSEGTTRVTWEIEPVGDSCRLVVTHDQLSEDANAQLYGGWPMILSGLKTLLEAGETSQRPDRSGFLNARNRLLEITMNEQQACRSVIRL